MRIISPVLLGGAAMLAVAAIAAPSRVSGGGTTLVSPNVELAAEAATYPAGPHSDLADTYCLACHSASMALTQPRMSADQWKGIVEKMRDTYKAPVPDDAIPGIVAYFTAPAANPAR